MGGVMGLWGVLWGRGVMGLWGYGELCGVLGCTVVLCPEHSRDPKVSNGVGYGVVGLWSYGVCCGLCCEAVS